MVAEAGESKTRDGFCDRGSHRGSMLRQYHTLSALTKRAILLSAVPPIEGYGACSRWSLALRWFTF